MPTARLSSVPTAEPLCVWATEPSLVRTPSPVRTTEAVVRADHGSVVGNRWLGLIKGCSVKELLSESLMVIVIQPSLL